MLNSKKTMKRVGCWRRPRPKKNPAGAQSTAEKRVQNAEARDTQPRETLEQRWHKTRTGTGWAIGEGGCATAVVGGGVAAAEGGATTAGCVVTVGAFSAAGGTVATVGTAAGCRDAVVDGENTGGTTGGGLGAVTTTGWAAG